MRAVLWVVLLGGCGFDSLPAGGADLAGSDGALAPGTDLAAIGSSDLAAPAGADLAGADLAGAAAPDLAPANLGPGPLGALPAGFCCASNEQCRSRVCQTGGGGPSFCDEDCDLSGDCTAWGAGWFCEPASNRCRPTGTPYDCHPVEQYTFGTKPIGACCAHGFAKAGQECLGGRCVTTGADGNPFYCTQGCNQNSPCPGGYTCADTFCWNDASFGDPNATYTCQ